MDLVSRESLYKYVASLEETYRNELLEIPAEHPCFTAQNKLLNTVSMIKFAIADASTIKAKPVRYGQWIHKEESVNGGWVAWYCTACDKRVGKHRTPYCPNCGAEMRDYL